MKLTEEIPGRFLHDYIGDGAYIYMDSGRNIVLYTSNGIREDNHVVIDVGDIPALLRWIERRKDALDEHDHTENHKENHDGEAV